MLVYILGFLDLWTGAILIPLHLGWLPYHLAIVHSMYLFAKGMFFWGELYSVLDVLVSIYLLFLVFGFANMVVSVVAVLYLIHKAILSLKL